MYTHPRVRFGRTASDVHATCAKRGASVRRRACQCRGGTRIGDGPRMKNTRTAPDLLSLAANSDGASPEALALRAAPHNIDAEQALLGAMLVNNEAHDRVSSFLDPHHFFDPLHQQIYETAAKLIASGKQATPVTLRTFFESAAPIEPGLTVPQYLGRLAANATTIINALDYGRTIHDLAIRRQLILIGEDMVNSAYDAPVDFPPDEQIEDVENRLFSLAETGKFGQGFMGFSSALTNAIEMANNAYQRAGGLSGISTGLRDLDSKMGGLQSSDLIILAGRPSMGKTALVTNIAFNVAKNYKVERQSDGTDKVLDGAVVGFFSLEMSSEQLATRILAEQAEISSEKIRRGMINENEFKRLVQVSQQMASLPLYIDQTGGISIAQLAARARRLKRQRGLGLLIVDYLQLLTGSKRTSEGRVQEVSEITTGLKALAKELNVPVIALSQLSRQVEQREDKRPQLSDLRESGSIEQDADVVMFVFREEYYVERTKPSEGTAEFQEWMAKMQMVSGKAEAIIGKQRHGPVGTVTLSFEGQYTRFGNLAQDQYLPERYE
jgi:replicative DNA helicase